MESIVQAINYIIAALFSFPIENKSSFWQE